MSRIRFLLIGWVFSPSFAAADVSGHVELLGAIAMPSSGDTSGELDYADHVKASPKLGLRGGPVWKHGHLFVGVEGGGDWTWYREQDDDAAAELSRLRVLAGARVGYQADTGAIAFVRAAAGLDRVSADFHGLLETLCGDGSSDVGLGWEVGGGFGHRRGRVTFSLQLAVTGGRHDDHRPACTIAGQPDAAVDVLDYNAIDVDLGAGIDVSFL